MLNKYDVAIVNFPYEDDPTLSKRRPCLIINKDTAVLLAAKITGKDVRTAKDYQLINWKEAGLNKPSVVRLDKVADISDFITVKIGHLSEEDIDNVEKILNELKGSKMREAYENEVYDRIFTAKREELEKFLDNLGYDVNHLKTKMFMDSVAEYLVFCAENDQPMSVEDWYDETKVNYPEDFEDVPKKSVNEAIEENKHISKETQEKWANQRILHDEDQWGGKYKTYGDMWKGEGYILDEAIEDEDNISDYEFYCPECGEKTVDELEIDPYGHHTWRCASCGYTTHNVNELKEGIEDEEVTEVEQEFTSANTSINKAKLPAIFKLITFEPNTVNLDFGGGKFDNAAEYLKDYDVVNLVYDPYNRSKEHNAEVIKQLKERGGADTATCSNVLNVIKEPEARHNVLSNIKKFVKPNGKVYITVYEGSGTGEGGATSAGYQLNRKTADYLDEIKEIFPDAKRNGKLIVATAGQVTESLLKEDVSNVQMRKRIYSYLSDVLSDTFESETPAQGVASHVDGYDPEWEEESNSAAVWKDWSNARDKYLITIVDGLMKNAPDEIKEDLDRSKKYRKAHRISELLDELEEIMQFTEFKEFLSEDDKQTISSAYDILFDLGGSIYSQYEDLEEPLDQMLNKN